MNALWQSSQWYIEMKRRISWSRLWVAMSLICIILTNPNEVAVLSPIDSDERDIAQLPEDQVVENMLFRNHSKRNRRWVSIKTTSDLHQAFVHRYLNILNRNLIWSNGNKIWCISHSYLTPVESLAGRNSRWLVRLIPSCMVKDLKWKPDTRRLHSFLEFWKI